MSYLRKYWNNFKSQPDIWFFYGFLATFTLSIRKVIIFYPMAGSFNEYTGIYLYLSDIFLLATLVSFLIIILCNKYNILSSSNTVPRLPSEMFHACPVKCSTLAQSNVPRGTYLTGRNILYGVEYILGRKTIYIGLAIIIWSFISLIWAQMYPLALFRSIKLLELFCLFLYIGFRIVPRGTILKRIFQIIIIIGLIQAIIAILQFILQHSIGLFWLKESLISPNIAGVAKIVVSGERIIRAYGLFPHPNVLGGFLLLSIIITFWYRHLFRVKHATTLSLDLKYDNVPRGTISDDETSVKPKTNKSITDVPHLFSRMFHVEQFLWSGTSRLLSFALIIQILAQMLTFSKSAIIGTFIVLLAFYYNIRRSALAQSNVPRGTYLTGWNNWILRGKYGTCFKNTKIIVLIILIVTMSLIILKPNLNSIFFQSLNERLIYLNVSPARIAMQRIAGGRGTVDDMRTFIFGVGQGQFVPSMDKYANSTLENWQYQPVHNIFLLIWSELGIVGLGLFIWLLWKLFHVKQFTNKNVPSQQYTKCSTLFPSNVPPQKEANCSTRNNWLLRGRRGTYLTGWNNSNTRSAHGTITVQTIFKSILIGCIFIMLFDHYFWDIQQGQIMLWMTLGFLAGESTT